MGMLYGHVGTTQHQTTTMLAFTCQGDLAAGSQSQRLAVTYKTSTGELHA
jgi:hypothetical protein